MTESCGQAYQGGKKAKEDCWKKRKKKQNKEAGSDVKAWPPQDENVKHRGIGLSLEEDYFNPLQFLGRN